MVVGIVFLGRNERAKPDLQRENIRLSIITIIIVYNCAQQSHKANIHINQGSIIFIITS